MNIENCPICGGKPLDKWELNYSTGGATQSGQACCGVDCNTNELWNKYAVAMELLIALGEMDKLDAEMWATGAISDDLKNRRIAAHHRICKAMDSKLKLFGEVDGLCTK